MVVDGVPGFLSYRIIARIQLFQRLVLLLMLGFLPLVVDPYVLASFVDTKFLMMQLLILLLVMAEAVKWLLGAFPRRIPWMAVPLVLLVFLYFSYYFTDPNPDFVLLKALKYGLFLLIPLFFVGAFETRRDLAAAEHFLVILTLPMLFYSILQYMGYEFFEYQYEIEKSKVQGTLGNSHFLGGYLAVFVFIVLNRIIQSRRLGVQIAYSFFFPLILLVLIVARSRGAMLCVMAAAFLYLIVRAYVGWRQHQKVYWKWVLVSCLVGCLLAPVGLWWSGQQPENNLIRRVEFKFHRDLSLNNRIVLSLVSLQMWANHPWRGIGLDRYPVEFFPTLVSMISHPNYVIIQKLAEMMESTQANEAHNDFLQTLAETGLVGYGLLLAVCLIAFYGLVKLLRAGTPAVESQDFSHAGMLLLALLTALTQMVYSFPLHLPSNGFLTFFVFGSAAILMKRYGVLEFRVPGWCSTRWVRYPLSLVLVGLSLWSVPMVLRQYLGLLYLKTGLTAELEMKDLHRARYWLDSAAFCYPENGEINFYQARILSYSPTDLRKALAKLDEAERTFSNSSLRLVRSQLLLDLFRYSEALRKLEPLSLVTRRLENLHLARGMVFYNDREYEKAAEELAAELDINPKNQQALLYLAQCHFELGNYYRAEELFLRAARREIKSIDVAERLGDIYSGPRFSPQKARLYYYQALNYAIEAGGRQRIYQIEKKIKDLERTISLKMEHPQFRGRMESKQ